MHRFRKPACRKVPGVRISPSPHKAHTRGTGSHESYSSITYAQICGTVSGMDKQTIEAYNRLAQEYDKKTVDFWDRFPRTFVAKFVELSGKSILDVGSGPGRDGLLLQQAGKDVMCIDASEAMVQLSSARGLPSILAEFDALPFENQTYDGVWSYTALLHTPKKSVETPLQEISRVLKPSGLFALGLIEGDTEEYKESSGVDMPRWFSFYQKEEVERLCEKQGFELVYFETFKPGSKNYLNFIFLKK
jgi:ubiquinone/menaquinone biosynthesis C-methylase UbiE